MRLTERIHLVGSGALGLDLTDPLDCHVYLIDGGSELALVDCGAGPGLPEILANVRANGFEPERIRHVLITHAHGDHAGGLARLRRLLPGAVAYGSAETAEILEAGDEERAGLRAARAAGIYPAGYRLEPAPVEVRLVHGDRLRVGEVEVTAMATPGHASHSLSFLTEGALFCGDLLFHGGRVSLLNLPDCSIADLDRSIRMVAELDFAALLPGHLTPSLRDGRRHALEALKRLDGLAVPHSIL